jgi:hypothetical protein
MEKRLVLQDSSGQIIRTYSLQGETAHVVRRGDTQRLELVAGQDKFKELKQKKIPFQIIGEIQKDNLLKQPLMLGELGSLQFLDDVENISRDEIAEKESDKEWYSILATVLILAAIFLGFILSRNSEMTDSMRQELKQEVVKIMKSMPKKQVVDMSVKIANPVDTPKTQVSKTKAQDALKRMGALGALGSLSKSAQHGGLNLGAAQTSAGPGLGGTQGSGGTQTSLYAKGITSAPLGVGGNIQGAGGYGTKGKGGGQAGFGKLSMVGSAGTNPIPLTQEATVASGLDRDAIAAVINKNIGQVRFCYEQGLQGNPNLSGRIAMDFTIGGNGLVKAASVANTSMNSKVVEDCITLRLKTWKFPLPQGAVDVKVTYPFVLRRAGQG